MLGSYEEKHMSFRLTVLLLLSVLVSCSGILGDEKYALTYWSNTATTGKAPSDSDKYPAGSLIIILENSGHLSKVGYAFSGWNTKKDGSGTSYAAGETLALGAADLALYAQFSPLVAHSVTYVTTGSAGLVTGAVPTDSGAYLVGATVTVLGSNTLASTGYKFMGWSTTPGGAADHQVADTFTMGSASLKLYSAWSTAYTVTYNSEGADIPSTTSDGTTYTAGARATVMDFTPGSIVRSGYKLAGWNDRLDRRGNSRAADGQFTIVGNLTLYPVWIPQNLNYAPWVDPVSAEKLIALTGYAVTAPSNTLTIPDGVAQVSGFADCVITGLVLPSTVTSIGASAFENCRIATLTLPSGLVSIGSSAFASNSFASVTLPSSLRTLGDKVFSNCSSLTSVTLLSGPPTGMTSSSLVQGTAVSVIHVPNATLTAYQSAPYWSSLGYLMVSP